MANPAIETSTLCVVLMTTLLFGTLTAPVLSLLGLEDKTDWDIGVSDAPEPAAAPPEASIPGSMRNRDMFHGSGWSLGRLQEQQQLVANEQPSTASQAGTATSLDEDGERITGVHRWWKQMDLLVMKPLFGGKGAVAVSSPGPGMDHSRILPVA